MSEPDELVIRDGREMRSLTKQPIDAGAPGLLISIRRHAPAKWLQLFVGFGTELLKRDVIALLLQRLDEACIELIETRNQRVAGLTANAPRRGACGVQFADESLQNRVECAIRTRSTSGQASDYSFVVCRKRGPRTHRVRAA